MKKYIVPAFFLLPALLVFTTFIIFPVIGSFYYSFTNWDGLSATPQFIGIKNFENLLHDETVWKSLGVTFQIAIILMLGQNVLGLALALGLQGSSWVQKVLRVWYMIPLMLSYVAISYIWNYMYDPRNGIINFLLRSVGLSNLTQDWLGNTDLAVYSVIFSIIWQSFALCMLIYVAGLQAIPKDLYEAANIDGAGKGRMFVNITFPLVAPAFTINMVVTMIFGLKIFDQIFIMTNGGPGGVTENLAMLLYRQAFTFRQMGYGSAIAIVMFLIILVVSLLQVIILRKREVEH